MTKEQALAMAKAQSESVLRRAAEKQASLESFQEVSGKGLVCDETETRFSRIYKTVPKGYKKGKRNLQDKLTLDSKNEDTLRKTHLSFSDTTKIILETRLGKMQPATTLLYIEYMKELKALKNPDGTFFFTLNEVKERALEYLKRLEKEIALQASLKPSLDNLQPDTRQETHKYVKVQSRSRKSYTQRKQAIDRSIEDWKHYNETHKSPQQDYNDGLTPEQLACPHMQYELSDTTVWGSSNHRKYNAPPTQDRSYLHGDKTSPYYNKDAKPKKGSWSWNEGKTY